MPKNVAALNTDTHVKTDPVRQKHTIGIDLGDRTTHFCVLNTDGTIAEEGRFRTEAANFEKLISRFGISRVALEVGMQSRWVSNLPIRAGHEVIVANARSVRLIADSKHKSDRIDARKLARLARTDPKPAGADCPQKHRKLSGSHRVEGSRSPCENSDKNDQLDSRNGKSHGYPSAELLDRWIRQASVSSNSRRSQSESRPNSHYDSGLDGSDLLL
jgi:Transposase